MRLPVLFSASLLLSLCSSLAFAIDWGLEKGTVELKSVGPMAYGPDGVLFVSDPADATIYAIDTGSKEKSSATTRVEVKGLQTKLQELLGAPADVVDLAVNPQSGDVILAVAGKTNGLVRVEAEGKLALIDLKSVPCSVVSLPNPPASQQTPRGNRRMESITDLAYVNGKVLVAGLSGADAPSTVREIAFPFDSADEGVNLEIYHAAHGKVENHSAVRTFIPLTINGEPSVLAGFTCTPLVRFPLKSLEKGEKVRGTTVAELGNRNKPLDIIVYQKEGKDYLLMANTTRGVMKIGTDSLGVDEGLSKPVSGGGTAGQAFEKIESLTGVVQLDKLNDQHAVVVVQQEGGNIDLLTIALP